MSGHMVRPVAARHEDPSALPSLDVPVDVHSRAIVAAGSAVAISDPRLPDQPLVFVNPAFERTTGYSAADSLGRNCRFLQGPGTDPAAVQELRVLLREQRQGAVTLLNYRKDGTAFWNELSIAPVLDDAGQLTHYVGIQNDVTARVQAEEQRREHLAAEQRARAQAERAQLRLAVLADATAILSATLDGDQSLQQLADLVVPMIADDCVVELDATGIERPTLVTDTTADGRELLGRLGAQSALVVPLRSRAQTLGTLTLLTRPAADGGSGRDFDHDDLTMAADLGRRAALAVDNTRRSQRERTALESLQRSLLPTLPVVAGLDLAARYLPAGDAAQVGGDWYDLFALPDGAIAIAVGDVMGHDLTAAASMGQLRSVLRSYAWQGDPPALVLERLDQLVQALEMAQLATAVYARLHLPVGDEPGSLRLANAGHLPPVLRSGDGEARLVTEGQSMLIGAVADSTRDEVQLQVRSGDLLVLCTDGLVERRDDDLTRALHRLRAAVASAPQGSADEVCDYLLRAMSHGASPQRAHPEPTDGDQADDITLLVVRLL